MSIQKLAKWAEWHDIDFWQGAWWGIPPKSNKSELLPNFPESLDACFKWLVPKVPRLMRVDLGVFERWYCLLHQYKEGLDKLNYINEKDLETDDTAAVAETPALALCRAIEKLIEDKEAMK